MVQIASLELPGSCLTGKLMPISHRPTCAGARSGVSDDQAVQQAHNGRSEETDVLFASSVLNERASCAGKAAALARLLAWWYPLSGPSSVQADVCSRRSDHRQPLQRQNQVLDPLHRSYRHENPRCCSDCFNLFTHSISQHM